MSPSSGDICTQEPFSYLVALVSSQREAHDLPTMTRADWTKGGPAIAGDAPAGHKPSLLSVRAEPKPWAGH